MANWSYNGVILPDFPTDFGEYTDQYHYRLIQWNEEDQYYNALISATPFVVRQGDTCPVIYDQSGHGNYHMYSDDLSAWKKTGFNYPRGVALYIRNGNDVVWADHDIIDERDGSVYMMASDPVSPGSTITGIWLNAAKLELKRGESFQFVPSVTGTGIFSKRVLYTLSGNDAHGGTTLSPEGLLTIGETEYVSSFKVTAAAQQDPSFTYTVSVTVTDRLYKVQTGLATDLFDYNGVHLPAFPTDFGEYTDQYRYRLVQWNEEDQYYNALTSATPFVVRQGADCPVIYDQSGHGNYHMYSDDLSVWKKTGFNYPRGLALYIRNGNDLIWTDHDVVNEINDTVYMRASEPSQLCFQTEVNGNPETQFVGSSVCMDVACVDLNTTDEVYTVMAWLYKVADGLDTTLPATYTSAVFGGPAWKERVTFTGLEPYTAYGVYTVVCVDGVATDHNGQQEFTTLHADVTVSLDVKTEEVTMDGCTLAITPSGLSEDEAYQAEVIVYNPLNSSVAFRQVLPLAGSGTVYCKVTGLQPHTDYAVSVDVFLSGEETKVRGDYAFTTAREQTDWGIYAGVAGIARAIRAVYVGVNGRARRVKGVYLGVNGRAQPLK